MSTKASLPTTHPPDSSALRGEHNVDHRQRQYRSGSRSAYTTSHDRPNNAELNRIVTSPHFTDPWRTARLGARPLSSEAGHWQFTSFASRSEGPRTCDASEDLAQVKLRDNPMVPHGGYVSALDVHNAQSHGTEFNDINVEWVHGPRTDGKRTCACETIPSDHDRRASHGEQIDRVISDEERRDPAAVKSQDAALRATDVDAIARAVASAVSEANDLKMTSFIRDVDGKLDNFFAKFRRELAADAREQERTVRAELLQFGDSIRGLQASVKQQSSRVMGEMAQHDRTRQALLDNMHLLNPDPRDRAAHRDESDSESGLASGGSHRRPSPRTVKPADHGRGRTDILQEANHLPATESPGVSITREHVPPTRAAGTVSRHPSLLPGSFESVATPEASDPSSASPTSRATPTERPISPWSKSLAWAGSPTSNTDAWAQEPKGAGVRNDGESSRAQLRDAGERRVTWPDLTDHLPKEDEWRRESPEQASGSGIDAPHHGGKPTCLYCNTIVGLKVVGGELTCNHHRYRFRAIKLKASGQETREEWMARMDSDRGEQRLA
ncbi:hypothetical protein LTR53_001002 [Teratosphaeriaceae sp. CCFEE 6253]|nr:hypothetical protein LTR53_001002 [Teratosphaeriaceae sp. CCFEE 6253]